MGENLVDISYQGISNDNVATDNSDYVDVDYSKESQNNLSTFLQDTATDPPQDEDMDQEINEDIKYAIKRKIEENKGLNVEDLRNLELPPDSPTIIKTKNVPATDDKELSMCIFCHRPFKHKKDMVRHMQEQHSGMEKKYECEVCCKKFMRADALRCHMRKHETHLDFVCSYCDRGFGKPGELNAHMLLHITNEDTNYYCQFCGEKFAILSLLKPHLMAHSTSHMWHCHSCQNKYSNVKDLKIHMRERHSILT